MAITELRHGVSSYPLEFVQKLPKGNILIIIHKHSRHAYIITDIIENISVPVVKMTPICSISDKENRETAVALTNLFDEYKVLSLSRFIDIKKIVSWDCYE